MCFAFWCPPGPQVLFCKAKMDHLQKRCAGALKTARGSLQAGLGESLQDAGQECMGLPRHHKTMSLRGPWKCARLVLVCLGKGLKARDWDGSSKMQQEAACFSPWHKCALLEWQSASGLLLQSRDPGGLELCCRNRDQAKACRSTDGPHAPAVSFVKQASCPPKRRATPPGSQP